MNYVRNAWYAASWACDIAAEKLLGIRILNDPIVIWRNAAGALTAFEDRCIHRLAPLSLGRCEGEKLRCMYHGLLYDRTGRVVDIPGQEKNRIPDTLRVRTYPVVERHGCVWVWMGNAAADESLIPPVIDLDQPAYANYFSAQGQMDFAAEGFLVSDNLLDLSHLSFLHAESFDDLVSQAWAREPPKFTKRERSVRTEQWLRSQPFGGGSKPGERVDTYTRTDFYVPGVLVIMDRGYPVGTADTLNGQEPDPGQPAYSISGHLVTPMTSRSTRYFFWAAFHRDYDPSIHDHDAVMTYAQKGFNEDKKMIEAQQQILDSTPGWRFIPTRNDRGVLFYNQILEKLVREESSQVNPSSSS